MYDCVIPAAGASSRMGAFKPLLPFGPASVVEATVGSALAAGCRVVLVVGYRGAELASLFAGRPGVLVAENPDWERGMLGSLQTGLKCVASPCFFTIPADMPLVPPAVYGLLLRAREAGPAAEASEPAAYFASRGGRAGHPVLIPSSWIAEMLRLPPGGRMRSYLERRRMVLVEAGTDAVFADLDGPEEYRRAIDGLGPPA
ncbi:MAG TPA: NTP transferase domain-containing protein [Rectinemataceae bacterium]|nr:NTP transferase domain-containing protein [Rectinemataceae bacterium]